MSISSYNKFNLVSKYEPTGDQPQAIQQLVDGVNSDVPAQTLMGVTGSGKTFTMANVINQVNRPTLVLSHNKTLAAQLYSEFKTFFPENSVHYFVSYYDYFQPEAYIPSSDKYIEKDLMINQEIDRLRLATTSALLSGRRDIIVVSSVSCLYGMGNPDDFDKNIIHIRYFDQIIRYLICKMCALSANHYHHGASCLNFFNIAYCFFIQICLRGNRNYGNSVLNQRDCAVL